MKYYDRALELNLLKDIQKKSFAEFSKMTVLKGRRRIGKTTLGMLSMEGEDTVYLFVSRKAEADLCTEYAEAIRQSLNEFVPQGIYHFKDIFSILMNIGRHRRFNLFIDEFQDFLYVNPSIYSDIQDVWDRQRRDSRVNLVVSGSVFTLMEKIFKDEKQPLFGRADLSLALDPFRTDVLKEIIKDHKSDYSNDDLLALYCFTGGVPKYVELLMDNGCTDLEKMVSYITRPDSQFFDEGKNMLIQEFGKQYSTYFSILGLIAAGEVTLPQIEGMLGEKSLGAQMKILEEEYGLIKKKRPIRAKDGSKSVRYEVNDIFLRFWFRYFYRYRSLIEIKNYSALASIILNEYQTYSGRVLERWFRQKMMESLQYSEIGGWWHPRKGGSRGLNENEIDIVSVDLEGRVHAYEVKRNRKKYSADLLEAKVSDMRQTSFGQAEIIAGCLSLDEM
ncbi:MAG: ATP-binding protein [Candidatus Cryptobacteroides sp.]